MTFTLEGCESLAIGLQDNLSNAVWGNGTVELNYTDDSLTNQILEKTIDSTENKGNGELLVVANIDFSEANGSTISETGLKTTTAQATLSNHYGLEKNASEKYIYFYDLYMIPKESLL